MEFTDQKYGADAFGFHFSRHQDCLSTCSILTTSPQQIPEINLAKQSVYHVDRHYIFRRLHPFWTRLPNSCIILEWYVRSEHKILCQNVAIWTDYECCRIIFHAIPALANVSYVQKGPQVAKANFILQRQKVPALFCENIRRFIRVSCSDNYMSRSLGHYIVQWLEWWQELHRERYYWEIRRERAVSSGRRTYQYLHRGFHYSILCATPSINEAGPWESEGHLERWSWPFAILCHTLRLSCQQWKLFWNEHSFCQVWWY